MKIIDVNKCYNALGQIPRKNITHSLGAGIYKAIIRPIVTHMPNHEL